MNIKQTSFAAALALLSFGPAHAEGLKPFQGRTIDLGDVSAVAYYTVERVGFRVVATLAKKAEDAIPVRIVAVLTPGQSLTLSTPHEAGAPADAVEMSSSKLGTGSLPGLRADRRVLDPGRGPMPPSRAGRT